MIFDFRFRMHSGQQLTHLMVNAVSVIVRPEDEKTLSSDNVDQEEEEFK